MYESYAWPGAGSRAEKNMLIKLVKEFFENLVGEIEKREKKD